MKNKQNLKVYFDGLCVVCSKEISHYQKQTGSERIDFIDICSVGFNAAAENVDPIQVHKFMHARRPDGSLATHMDAFIEIWKALPKFNLLAKASEYKIVRMGLDVAYFGFSKIRPWLPRYKKGSNCEQSPYCELKNI